MLIGETSLPPSSGTDLAVMTPIFPRHLSRIPTSSALCYMSLDSTVFWVLTSFTSETLYLRSGFGASSLLPEQWRFDGKSVDTFCANFLGKKRVKVLESPSISVAMAGWGEGGREEKTQQMRPNSSVHSLRAVSLSDARKFAQFAFAHQIPLHIHLEEQPVAKPNFGNF